MQDPADNVHYELPEALHLSVFLRHASVSYLATHCLLQRNPDDGWHQLKGKDKVFHSAKIRPFL